MENPISDAIVKILTKILLCPFGNDVINLRINPFNTALNVCILCT